VSLDRLSHWNVCLRVLLHLMALALLWLRAGACWVPIHRALLLLKALVHEAGDEAEGGQEDEEQDYCDHARAFHPFALAAANLQAHSSVSTTWGSFSLLECYLRQDLPQAVYCRGVGPLKKALTVHSGFLETHSACRNGSMRGEAGRSYCTYLGRVDLIVRDDLSRLRLDEWGSDRDARDRSGICTEYSSRNKEADVQLLVQVHGLETWSFASQRHSLA
jgi:hypothetical protein